MHYRAPHFTNMLNVQIFISLVFLTAGYTFGVCRTDYLAKCKQQAILRGTDGHTQRATVPRRELYYLGQSKSNRTSWSWTEWFIQAVAADCRDNRLPPGKVPLQQTKLSGTHKPSDSWHSVWIKFWRFNYRLIIQVYISDHQWEVWPLINS